MLESSNIWKKKSGAPTFAVNCTTAAGIQNKVNTMAKNKVNTMANASGFPARFGHMAVHMENCIVVFGGSKLKEKHVKSLSMNKIWMYNLNTEKWGKHVIPHGKTSPPQTTHSCAVVIEGTTYMFGGYLLAGNLTNAMWKLARTPTKCFEWKKVIVRDKPSPRYGHSGWEYAGQLWTFGGYGLPLEDYLHDHGDFNGHFWGDNNQLLCFNPKSREWRNPKSSGTVPGTCMHHATTIIGDKVWLHGEHNDGLQLQYNGLHQLDMISLTWTMIEIEHLQPPCRYKCSLNALTDHQLVLHGGTTCPHTNHTPVLNDTWVLDLPSLSWKKHRASYPQSRCSHTGSAVMNGTVIIGGRCYADTRRRVPQVYNDVITVRLEPQSLQQMAIRTIDQHRHVLPWELLPNQLKTLFLFPVTDVPCH